MAQGRGSAVIFTVAVLALLNVAAATDCTVGGETGWTFPPSAGYYDSWASSQTCGVGDNLVFTYMQGLHDVQVVTASEYAACSSTGKSYTSGSDSIPLTKAGDYYFICSLPGHCQQGMKFKYTVKGAAATPPATPPPKATPPPVESPPPKAAPPPVESPPPKATPPPASPPKATPPPVEAPVASPPKATPPPAKEPVASPPPKATPPPVGAPATHPATSPVKAPTPSPVKAPAPAPVVAHTPVPSPVVSAPVPEVSPASPGPVGQPTPNVLPGAPAPAPVSPPASSAQSLRVCLGVVAAAAFAAFGAQLLV